ncbi:site-specific DNA-methyltransferase [Mycoplasmopsis verecunda]|uniref:Adenine-specific DNA-methyltransferase n=1 Tax=Mycoplasmopsis verecunda TaxID=171291 RepID=A0A1T4KFY1_9BACT|nr:site-specific DNA-methyltransferase [Mycoplasmopsis verecunda]WPB54893.1 site-specific DNA-methyltransferase [Mycoplasmopsis verecunda]SJZ41243.1 adenine-specific DNA-methyltransferase [Mycoplasmopsis verecunda]
MRERERAGYEYNYDVIYIDPPYNTEAAKEDKNSTADDKQHQEAKKFIYRDKYSRNGWLNMMYERLLKAKRLLKDDGVIFVSIDDNEQAYLKVIMDEIFGEENFVSNILWQKTRKPSGNTGFRKTIDQQHEFILVYAKNLDTLELTPYFFSEEELNSKKYINKDEYFNERGFYKLTPLWHSNSGSSFQYNPSLDYEIEAPDGTKFKIWQNEHKDPSKWMCYTWNKKTFDEGNSLGLIEIKRNSSNGKWEAYRKMYTKVKYDPKKHQLLPIKSNVAVTDRYYDEKTTDSSAKTMNDLKLTFPFTKPYELIAYLINLNINENARVLDFYAGSGTTGHSVWSINKNNNSNRTFTIVTNEKEKIAIPVTYERFHRISKGIGTKGEKDFNWLKSNKPYEKSLEVYDTVYYDINVTDEIEQPIELFINEIKHLAGVSLSDEDINKALALLTELYAFNEEVTEEQKEENEAN